MTGRSRFPPASALYRIASCSVGGKVSADGGGQYSGEITDPANDKTYSGSASVSGGSMKMKGCVLGGLICRSQTWTKL